MRFGRPALIVAGVLLASPAVRADDGTDFFEKKVRPVLAEHCYSCHAGKKSKGGLKLDTAEAIRAGGDSGPAVAAKDEKSLLLRAVTHAADAPAMPPEAKLPDAAVADLKTWVAMGAPLPASTAKPEGDPRKHWAFQPATEHPAPKVSDAKWPITKADSFVLNKLDEHKFSPAPPAARRTLVRRVYFDLIGLPPTLEQVEAFATDTRPDAYERLVDGLLASPRFGEKWARHWFDVARYAEDNSTGESTCKPPRHPHRYRDWAVAAFNADVPFDRFVRLQLAADLLPDAEPDDLPALGFLGLSPVYHKEPKLSKDVIAAFVADEWDERMDAITRGFLGLTVACARCHDHKFDPISTKDYYALAGVVANTQLVERSLTADTDPFALNAVRVELLDATQRASYAKEMRDTARKEKRDARPFDKQAKALDAKVEELKAKEKKLDVGRVANVVRDAGTRVNGDDPTWTLIDYKPGEYVDLPVSVRGDVTRPGPVLIPRRFLTVLSAGEPKPFTQGSGRRELADAIVTDAAGLTARVFVNRAWGWVYGRPLVGTPSNFGLLGEKPTHPQLLDDLAARFVANKWSVKWLVRELVLSAAYRQSASLRIADCGLGNETEPFAGVIGSGCLTPQSAIRNPQSVDPDNKWLWRGPRKRLELEQWRDAMLAVSGQLDLNGGGPSDNLDSPKSVRRTVYGKVSRERPADVHRLFDLPDPKGHGEKREATTTPVQQLYFLNSPFVRQAADGLAKAAAGKSVGEGTAILFRRVYLRDPTADELAVAAKLIQPKDGDKPAWELLAQALLASNEFLFCD